MMQNMFSKISLDYIKIKYCRSAKETVTRRSHLHSAKNYSNYNQVQKQGSMGSFISYHFILHIWVFCLYVCLHTMYMSGIREGQKRTPTITGVRDGGELLCGFWEWNPGLLEEQSLFLTSKPSLQASWTALLKVSNRTKSTFLKVKWPKGARKWAVSPIITARQTQTPTNSHLCQEEGLLCKD